jgi:hypothetical protein
MQVIYYYRRFAISCNDLLSLVAAHFNLLKATNLFTPLCIFFFFPFYLFYFFSLFFFVFVFFLLFICFCFFSLFFFVFYFFQLFCSTTEVSKYSRLDQFFPNLSKKRGYLPSLNFLIRGAY